MAHHAYERDPRLTHLDTEVVATGEDEARPYVVLADTVLYPEGGGQPADRGSLTGRGDGRGVEIVDVQRVEGAIRHYIDGPAPSGRVTVELDWHRRFDHMQQHTAQHVLTAVAEHLHGWSTTAFHLGQRTSDIEVDSSAISRTQLAALEEAVAFEIRSARPVTVRRVSMEEYERLPVRSRGLPAGHAGDVRLVQIEELDQTTCGGTHCDSTAEIEAVKLLDAEPMRGGTRIAWIAGARLRIIHGEHHRRNAQLRAALGVSDEDMVSAVETKVQQLKASLREIRRLTDELARAAAEGLVGRSSIYAGTAPEWLAGHWPSKDLSFLQRVAREVEGLAPDRAVFLTAGQGERGFFLVAGGPASDADVPFVGREIARMLGGKGGGSGRIFQGKASRLSARGEAVKFLRE